MKSWQTMPTELEKKKKKNEAPGGMKVRGIKRAGLLENAEEWWRNQ